MATGYVFDPIYLKHQTGQHPEKPERLTAIAEALRKEGLLSEIAPVQPRNATLAELMYVHSEEHVKHVEQVASSGGGYLDLDTVLSSRSYDAALMAAGGVMSAVESVMEGEMGNVFALVRPPGHHATPSRGMGFCLFNNLAIAARYAQKEHGIRRVMIVDFDVHHGNGTQEAFYDDDSVLYFSAHEFPFYPGTGDYDEIGHGRGTGFTVNAPLPSGVGDEGYRRVFEEVVSPVARRFQPELMMVSAGYDAHWADPLAMMQLSTTGFAGLMQLVTSLAEELCQGRMVVALEGGYDLRALASSVAATFNVMLGKDFSDPLGPSARVRHESSDLDSLLASIKELHGL